MPRPRVVVFGQVSLDGRLTLAPDVQLLHGDPRWTALVGKGDDPYARMQGLHKAQVFLEGSNSFILDSQPSIPLPPAERLVSSLVEDHLPADIARRPHNRGWFAAVDGRGRVRWSYTGFDQEPFVGWDLLVIVHRNTPPEYLAYLQRERINYLVAGAGPVDLAVMLDKMALRLGVTSVVCSAPGRLGGAMLRAGLVDEVDLEFLPAIIGGTATPSLFDGPELRPGQWPIQLQLMSSETTSTESLLVRYQVVPTEALQGTGGRPK